MFGGARGRSVGLPGRGPACCCRPRRRPRQEGALTALLRCDRARTPRSGPAAQGRPRADLLALVIVRSTKSKCNATILKRGVPIHASYGHYPNKRNFMRLGSEASVTYNIL